MTTVTIMAIPMTTIIIVLSIGCEYSGGAVAGGSSSTPIAVSAYELPYAAKPANLAITAETYVHKAFQNEETTTLNLINSKIVQSSTYI
jgi:hypothetical protein